MPIKRETQKDEKYLTDNEIAENITYTDEDMCALEAQIAPYWLEKTDKQGNYQVLDFKRFLSDSGATDKNGAVRYDVKGKTVWFGQHDFKTPTLYAELNHKLNYFNNWSKNNYRINKLINLGTDG